mmetsp:Transcript_23997/g.47973  ORF Transcript_23997/g.47973 Transcript_23997/m.47973 type:complete len:213 (+) Transcript_23997:620-1258(+)
MGAKLFAKSSRTPKRKQRPRISITARNGIISAASDAQVSMGSFFSIRRPSSTVDEPSGFVHGALNWKARVASQSCVHDIPRRRAWRAIAASSPELTASTVAAKSRRCSSVRVPCCPKSTNPRRPSLIMSRLPGCGSLEKTPSRRICHASTSESSRKASRIRHKLGSACGAHNAAAAIAHTLAQCQGVPPPPPALPSVASSLVPSSCASSNFL